MISCVGTESVEFYQPIKLIGKVEVYLISIIEAMRLSLKKITIEANAAFFKDEKF